jgi:hypothetical protein
VISRIGRRLAAGHGGAAFAAYLAVSFLLIGLPVAAHPERDMVGGLFTDPQIFIWSFAWWPHAILHGLNPVVTHEIWEPDGFNLAWATSVPGLAIVLAPVTLLFGPVLAYNVASVLAPAVAAWTGFLLCRRLTGGAAWPSLAGGYLFGFSTYVLSAELTHIFSAAVFLLPVVALLVVRFVEGDLTGRGLALRLGPVLAGQILISTEILFTLTLALGISLALALALVPDVRGRIARLLAPLAAAYGLAALITAPFLYYVATGTGFRPPAGANLFSADLLNLVVPTMATVGGWWGRHLAVHFPANDAERGTYLGIPLLAIVGLYGWQRWRTAGGRFLLVCFVLAVLAALGPWFTVDGSQQFLLYPWTWLSNKPLFRNVMPVRLMVYAALAAAVMAAIWAASRARPPWLRIALPALAALALIPNVSWSAWSRTPQVPPLFTTGLYKSCIARGENVLLLPFGTLGDAMLWQVRSNWWFRNAGGYVSPFPPASYTWLLGMQKVATEDIPPAVSTNDVLQLVRVKHVTSIVVDAPAASLWAQWLKPFGRPQAVGGAVIYRLSKAPGLRAACTAAARRTASRP